MPPRASSSRRALLRWAALALLLGGMAHLAFDTPALVFGAALAPAAVAAALVIRLDRRAHPRPQRWLAAFLWGAVVAPALAVAVNDAVRTGLGQVTDAGRAARLTGAFAAPAVEELAKGAALVLLVVCWRRALGGVRDGMVCGALVGVGFTMAENLYYFALAAVARGGGGLAESVYLRAALGGLLHPTFTAATGAGIGWRRWHPAARAAPWLGLAAAIAQHVAWNGVGAPWIDAATCGPGAPVCALDGRLHYWLLTAPAIVLGFLSPGLAGLTLAARREPARTGA